MSHFREDQLLRLTVNPCHSEDDKSGISAILRDPIDWNHFISRSVAEGVSCLIHLHLREFADAVPGEVRERLRRLYYSNLSRNMIIYEEMKRIVAAFLREDLISIPFKGVSFAHDIYNNIAMRPAADTDVLIRREDLGRADGILQSLGYRSPACLRDFIATERATSINSLLYTAPDRHPSRSFPVHLHWHLVNSTWPLTELVRSIDMKRIWDQARSVTLDDTKVMTLCPEHLLLYLAHHGLNHYFDRLILAADIRALLAVYGNTLDWELLNRDMEAFGLTDIVRKGTESAGALLGFDIPPQLGAGKGRDRRGYLYSYLAYFNQCKGLRAKGRFVCKTLVPDRLILAQSHGIPADEVGCLHYIRRAARAASADF